MYHVLCIIYHESCVMCHVLCIMYNRKLEPSSYYKQQDLPLQHKQQDKQTTRLTFTTQTTRLTFTTQSTRHMNIKIKRTIPRQAHTKQKNSKPQQDTWTSRQRVRYQDKHTQSKRTLTWSVKTSLIAWSASLNKKYDLHQSWTQIYLYESYLQQHIELN